MGKRHDSPGLRQAQPERHILNGTQPERDIRHAQALGRTESATVH
ncbi:MAG: hypothetical protein VKI82_10035 [Leptolyngbya sp.]|nr:hypothetical protein [Leptolyngbya sp.]